MDPRGKTVARRGRLTLLVVAVAASVAYRRWGKVRQESWGATPAEQRVPLPGDDLVGEPAAQVTRAITVHAPPERIWPWLVQIGADRGGFYSYDRLENLFGLGIHSAETIVEDWQGLDVGDVVAANRARTGGWVVSELRPNDALVLQVADPTTGRAIRRDEQLRWEFSWTFALRPTGAGSTRLLVRERTGFGNRIMAAVMSPIGFVSFVMTRRMLRGIKERAERTAAGPPNPEERP